MSLHNTENGVNELGRISENFVTWIVLLQGDIALEKIKPQQNINGDIILSNQ